MPRGSTVSQFIASLASRLAQLGKVSREGLFTPLTLSLLFSPSAYLSATQQHAARSSHLSLEMFSLELDLGSHQSDDGFAISGAQLPALASLSDVGLTLVAPPRRPGITLHGAAVSGRSLHLADGVCRLPLAHLRWRQHASDESGLTDESASVVLPVYLNDDRSELLFSCKLAIVGDKVSYVKRGAAITA